MAIQTKTCTSCKKELLVDNFYRRSERGDGEAGYSSQCKSCYSIIRRQRYVNHREQIATQNRKYRDNNREKIYERNRNWRNRKRKEIIEYLGGKCVRCGFSDPRALQVDHINGGGSRERETSSYKDIAVNGLYKSILENPGKYQLLCANCNWIKRVEEEEYAK